MDSDNVDMSHMSAAGRAKLSVLIEKDGNAELREHLLGSLGRREEGRGSPSRAAREIPDDWDVIWVMNRLREAASVRAASPDAIWPKAYGSAWPSIVQEKIPLVIQAEMAAIGELEARQEEQNRVRWQPTAAESSRAEEALMWPILYLGDQPDLARAVTRGALWESQGSDIGKRLKTKDPDERQKFFESRIEGLTIITQQLIAHHVPVS